MSDTNPHSPPGPYVLFDNLDDTNRLCMNVWNVYDELQKAEGLYMKYLYIYCNGNEMCINLWNMDFIKVSDNLNKEVEFDVTKTIYSFDDALKSRNLTINNISGTYYDHLPALQKNKKLRNLVFSSGDVKGLTPRISPNESFSYEHQLVVDENRPDSDIEWDISENVKVRFRINFEIYIDSQEKHILRMQFDKGARGMPAIVPVGWFPTRDMDGILISQEKAHSVDYFTFVKDVH
jgi:hypothetical protein